MIIDAPGDSYVPNGVSSQANVEKFVPAGVGSTHANNASVNKPLGLAFGGSDYLHVDTNNGKSIEKASGGSLDYVGSPDAPPPSCGRSCVVVVP